MTSAVLLPGDGIGPMVVRAAQRVLDRSAVAFDWVEAEIGWRCWCRDGDAVPQRTLDLLRLHRLGLFGAITSRPPAEARAALPRHLVAAAATPR